MFHSIVRELLAHKHIVIAAAAFAALTGSLSAIPSAAATTLPIDLSDIDISITDGDISIDFDDSYIRITDGDISISLAELLGGLGGGFVA